MVALASVARALSSQFDQDNRPGQKEAHLGLRGTRGQVTSRHVCFVETWQEQKTKHLYERIQRREEKSALTSSLA